MSGLQSIRFSGLCFDGNINEEFWFLLMVAWSSSGACAMKTMCAVDHILERCHVGAEASPRCVRGVTTLIPICNVISYSTLLIEYSHISISFTARVQISCHQPLRVNSNTLLRYKSVISAVFRVISFVCLPRSLHTRPINCFQNPTLIN